MHHYEIEVEKDTVCDQCGDELPKGIRAEVDDDTGHIYCSVICWEEANDPQDEHDECMRTRTVDN
jgi:hypothetical protein